MLNNINYSVMGNTYILRIFVSRWLRRWLYQLFPNAKLLVIQFSFSNLADQTIKNVNLHQCTIKYIIEVKWQLVTLLLE